MNLKTYGHATLSFDNNEKPILITDPWLIGSSYWRSWWLQHYPNESELDYLKNTQNIFLSHEHWDHAHFPSLKKLFPKKKIFIPTFNSKKLKDSLLNFDFDVTELKPNEWYKFDELKVMVITTYSEDSMMLFVYKNYLILNNNDAKPSKQMIKKILSFKKKNNLKLIILQSYSPASIVNSFRDNNQNVVSIKNKNDYVNYIQNICITLNANYFLPFASHAIFSRPDSEWANDHKVTNEDLEKNWNLKTKLLKSYTSFNLDNETFSNNVSSFNLSTKMNELANTEFNSNVNYDYELDDLNCFSNITKPVKFFLMFIYPKGLHFKFGDTFYVFNFLRDCFSKSKIIPSHYFEMPVKTFCEFSKYFNFTDVGAAFILKIIIKNKINIYQTYLLFLFLSYSEKGYFSNLKMFYNLFVLIKIHFFPKKII
ncbi:MBL fold metallo-hydrolase [Candidatus Pelagibacter sp. Uisw_090]|uniref:MBL fold metallo-hydrolase n=1 Tax=Candidatus Pelagibacter sp. Uisw_090 TaxID=3230993 RepID=UPI0039EC7B8E